MHACVRACVHVCVCACVRAGMRACVCASINKTYAQVRQAASQRRALAAVPDAPTADAIPVPVQARRFLIYTIQQPEWGEKV